MTARSRPIEVITGPDRRRHWSLEQKRAVVAEGHRSDTTPAAVARRQGLNTGQLYTSRRRLQAPLRPSFARVEFAEAQAPVAPHALRNLAVLLAAMKVFGTGWPDVIVAATMGGLGLSGGWPILSQAHRERSHAPAMRVVAAE